MQEYKFVALNDLSSFRGIKLQFTVPYTPKFTVPYTPQSNGVSKRNNLTLVNAILSMLYDRCLPKTYWDEVTITASFLHDWSPIQALPIDQTPCSLCFHRQPNLNQLKGFGSPAFAHIHSDFLHKLDFLTKPCIFLG